MDMPSPHHKAPTRAFDFTEVAERIGPQLAANAAAADDTDTFVAANYPLLKREGLISAGVPAELDGGGASPSELSDMLRVLAHHCSSTALALAMHTHQVAIPAWRWRHQNATAAEPLLRRVAAENIVLLTSGGSDWLAGSGRAEKVDGGYRITARKVFSSASEIGDLLMTSAVLDTTEGPKVLHFAIPMTSPAVRIDPVWKALGMRGTGSHDVVIDGHVVPEAAVSATRKAAEWGPLFHIIATVALPLIYAAYVGVAEDARSIALALARKRRHDPHIATLAGRMETALNTARVLQHDMIAVAERGQANAETVNQVMMGKAAVVENVLAVAALALEVAGGAGFYRHHGLERRFRDLQGARYHPMQQCQQAHYAGNLALGLPVDQVF
jgi:alkylation response protein AidB-like acyl-CoA dehydrogenase